MVGANINRDNGSPWALHNMDNTQAQFLRELRLLYQRSLRARSLATAARATLNAEGALNNTQQQVQQMQAVAAPAEDPCPLQAPPPLLLDLAFAQPTPAAAAATLAAAGAIAGAANPVPAAAPAPAGRTAAPAAAPQTAWQAEDEEDSDDEPPPGMIDSSGEEDDDYDGEQVTGFGAWRSPVLLRPVELPSPRIRWTTRFPQQQTYNDDVEMQDANTVHDAPSNRPAMPAIRRAWQRVSRNAAASTAQPQQQQPQQPHSADIGQLLPLLRVDQCRGPAPCSFLQPGVMFEGCQRLTQLGMRRRDEQWTVSVAIHDVDLPRGYVSGTMQASNVPGMQQPIETFWEGCVIDDANHTFFTRGWGANKETDLQHWAKFEGWSDSLKKLVIQHSGRCGVLEQQPVIFMRWKEQSFTKQGQQQSGLSIAGFYYIALNRITGHLRGFYYDPNSSPFQELNMTVAQNRDSNTDSPTAAGNSSSPGSSSGGGVAFASYSFA